MRARYSSFYRVAFNDIVYLRVVCCIFYSCGELSREDLTKFQRIDSGARVEELQDLYNVQYGSHRSQLSVIFDVIGTPTLLDLDFLDEKTAALLRDIEPRHPKVSCVGRRGGGTKTFFVCS